MDDRDWFGTAALNLNLDLDVNPAPAPDPDLDSRETFDPDRRSRKGRYLQQKQKSKRKTVYIVLAVLMVFLLAGAAAAAAAFYLYPRLEPVVSVEAGGDMPAAEEFLQSGLFRLVTLTGGLEDPSVLKVPGDYTVSFHLPFQDQTSILRVKDTIPPSVTVQSASLYTYESLTPEDLITSVEDVTETTVAFARAPDMQTPGMQDVVVRVTDSSGNSTEATAQVEVLADTQPPVIEGVKELTVQVGDTVSYKKDITVTDDSGSVELTVDNSSVDLNTPGIYPVCYSAVDQSGNTTTAETTLYVITPMSDEITEEGVIAAADKLLSEITNDSMSQYEKAEAIYWWCHDRIAYVDSSDKDNWVEAAYRGLIQRSGDCYVYAMTSKVLLTEAGIKNMVIEKIPTRTMHWWNLIDIGEGWHHFDTTRRAGGATFFYKTDAELMAYSDAHGGTHAYDRSQYPDIP